MIFLLRDLKKSTVTIVLCFFSFQEEGLILDPLRLNEEMKLNPDHPNLFKNGGSEDCTVKPGLTLQAVNLPLGNEVPEISPSQVHLDEFQKILWEERE